MIDLPLESIPVVIRVNGITSGPDYERVRDQAIDYLNQLWLRAAGYPSLPQDQEVSRRQQQNMISDDNQQINQQSDAVQPAGGSGLNNQRVNTHFRNSEMQTQLRNEYEMLKKLTIEKHGFKVGDIQADDVISHPALVWHMELIAAQASMSIFGWTPWTVKAAIVLITPDYPIAPPNAKIKLIKERTNLLLEQSTVSTEVEVVVTHGHWNRVSHYYTLADLLADFVKDLL